MSVTCTMFCPKCGKGYVVEDIHLQEFFVMEECEECNENNEFVFKEQIF